LRIAALSPFVDRRHGTERALAETLERLVRIHGYEVHLYSQRVQDLAVVLSAHIAPSTQPAIIWHRVPSLLGPHLLTERTRCCSAIRRTPTNLPWHSSVYWPIFLSAPLSARMHRKLPHSSRGITMPRTFTVSFATRRSTAPSLHSPSARPSASRPA